MLPQDLEESLKTKGYGKIRLLSELQLTLLRETYVQEQHHTNRDGDFWCTMFSQDIDHRRRVDKAIKVIVESSIREHFPSHNPLFANFMVKPSECSAVWPVHQDWTYVDESRSRSLAVGIPVEDLYLENRHLCMVPGNPRMRVPVRGPGIRDAFEL